MTTNATYRKVFYAAPDWFDIARGHGLEVDWDSDPVSPEQWDSACEAAGFNPSDYEVNFGVITNRELGALGGSVPEGIAGFDGSNFVVIRQD